jgi:DNA-binding HxlR family transcriptional regulator
MIITQEDYSDSYKYERKINEYEMEIRWQNELDSLPNDPVSAEHKLILKHVRIIIKRLRCDTKSATCIHNTELVRRTGLSEDTIQRKLKDLTSWGWITRHIIRSRTKGGSYTTEQMISLTGNLYLALGAAPMPKKRNHGGDRRKCDSCGSENITIYVAYECRDCGHIHHAEVTQQS